MWFFGDKKGWMNAGIFTLMMIIYYVSNSFYHFSNLTGVILLVSLTIITNVITDFLWRYLK